MRLLSGNNDKLRYVLVKMCLIIAGRVVLSLNNGHKSSL
jgi:hypothetical protein